MSAQFVLTIFPDGRVILSTEEEVSDRRGHELREAFKRWREEPAGVLILSARVEHATSFEIDLKEPAPVA